MDEKSIIRKVSFVGIFGNIVLVAFKLVAGIVGNSGAMVSDAIHSMSDVFATFIAFLGIKIAKKAPDTNHQYGHDRFECLAAIVLGFILMGTGLLIGWNALKVVVSGNYDAIEVPSTIALVAAIVSIVSKEAMFWYTRHYAKILDSSAFMADAWHHRSDALSSIGSLIGIGGAMLGYKVLDPIASIVICLCILKVSFDILKDAVDKVTDTSCGEAFEKEVVDFIAGLDGVDHVDWVRTRKFGNKVYIDAEISVDGELKLRAAHEIADKVHEAVEKRFENTKHIMIHENPTGSHSVG